MLVICNAAEPMVFKASKPSSNAERAPQGIKPGAKPGHKKHSTSSKQPSVSSKEATIGTGPYVLADKTQSVSKGVQPSFKDLNSPKDDPIIVVDDSDKDEEAEKVHATTNVEIEDTLVPKSSSPSSLPTELKDLPSKFNEQTKEVKVLKKQFHELEIELPGDLKEIPSKLEDFIKTVTSLTSQVSELKTLQWELPAEFLSVPSQVEMVQAKLKTLDALPSLLKKVTNALIQFAQAIASKKTRDTNVPSAG
ncbi:hypothetical protein Tco_1048772 [Tanacetum coccineum]